MNESLRVILEKNQTDWTEDDKKEIELAVKTFSEEVAKVCEAHGMQYRAVLNVTKSGIVPTLDVIPFLPEESK